MSPLETLYVALVGGTIAGVITYVWLNIRETR